MASHLAPDASALALEYTSLAANSYGRVACAALLSYDYLLTLDKEVELFWNWRSTGATALFMVNRYLVMILRLANLVGFMPMPDQRCAIAAKIALGFTLLQYIPWAMFAALRAFALSRYRSLSMSIFLLSITTPAVNISLYPLGFTGYYDHIFGCTVIDPLSLALSRKFVIICRTCFLVADLLLILITWSTISRPRIVDSVSRGYTGYTSGFTLADVLLQNGTMYFFVLLILHSLHLILSLCSVHVALQSLSYGYVTVFTESFTALLVSRFLLDLQEAHRNACDADFEEETEGETSRAGTLIFERVIGSHDSSRDS
ncbi:hypothetical protein K466DRAFT_648600 [Polyporus arcularius HHB13444]|uniref:DUF6533 domain-containing protein n=1 Tax=Polyporus arcularius HHB13444 TaxID=1314778 RepID=A0A5C3NVZ2_9APHY|nr:hypothetical protein K466DRAFT_648600 [Polyporus arcularius HHB13444]